MMRDILQRAQQANKAAKRGWTPEEEEAAFQALGARYARTALDARSDEDIADLHRWMDADIAASGKTGGKALDLGAGEGRSTQRLVERGFSAVGVERSPFVAERAPAGLVIVGDAQDIPAPDASQDLVICNSLLEHVLDPDRVLRELRRVLAPGGVCIVHTTNRAHWRSGEIRFPLFQWMPLGLRTWIWHMSGRTHISPHFFTYGGLAQKARDAGFEVSSPLDVVTPVRTGLKGLIVRQTFKFYRSPVGQAWIRFKSSVVELHLRVPAWSPSAEEHAPEPVEEDRAVAPSGRSAMNSMRE